MANEHLQHDNEAMAEIMKAAKTILTRCEDVDLQGLELTPRQAETLAAAALTLETTVNAAEVECSTIEDQARNNLAQALLNRLT